MTKENFERAKQIREDIRVVNKLCLNMDASEILAKDFEDWKNKTIKKYESEFDAL